MKQNTVITQELFDAVLQSALNWAKFNSKDDSEAAEDAINGTSENLRQKMEDDFNKYTFTKYEFTLDEADLIERYRFISARTEEAIVLFVKAYPDLTEQEYYKLHKGLVDITNSDKKWVAEDTDNKV